MADSADIRGKVPFRVTDPERIPSQRYYDEEFYKLECEKFWPHVWQMACRLEQIPNVGDWVEYSNLGKSVVVVRTKDGVKAYHNACRHRGVQLAQGHGNCKAQGFICPFHGWRFNMDGDNTFVYGRHLFSEAALDQADLNLKPCRVDLWGGCAFINFDDNAPSYRESIGPVADRLEAHGASKMRVEWWYATELPANWKLAMEAFMESYHVMRTHPQLHAAGSLMYASFYGPDTGSGRQIDPNATARENVMQHFRHMELISSGMAGMCHAKDVEVARQILDIDLPEDPQEAVMAWYGRLNHEITVQSHARGEPTPDLNAVAVSDPVVAIEYLFPHYFLLPFLSSMASYRIRPTGPETCLFEIWSLTLFAEGEEPPVVKEPTILAYDSTDFPPIPQQDYSNIPRQQIGLHSEGFEFMRISKVMEGLIGNYNRILDAYLAGVDPGKLAKPTQLLGGNFDGPILDLGL